ncbi:TPA: pyruvate dehydrogenase (acetyl-transferring), homodimeric type [Photobacterium damselae]|uniref:pyruvate dehydrogenase (acetyl-transferring), homodimeric type n=1 Tax=Photobacterium damselae TaxID=38293 RepID=UPI00030B8565|nr:pyruvate dehydrogenase (acetyl-transferring), homodimeric type [Photobacterium damselae]EJN6960666.1 pyruvate dehydrogenase (acetyl-transferring), homodimeric type [Photobacterium damselae]MCG3846181.1 pyruvate dehydrogenase (acetyl-transferring), homodimeric type [Photobacterium damselae]MCG9704223.1 pyruvate dehydrogenase (acetyl-transferring), homodimeric type [Photobacterium damselae]MCG9779354.1 pyruvate dehydrogenase (acetyl-transferring), homodimeric type [Photobacterium damselae]OLQ
MSEVMKHDVDALETQEWLAALESVVREEGLERAQYLLEQVLDKARLDGVDMPTGITTNYINTIPADKEPAYPGDTTLERRIRSIIRWNAIMIVLRASKKDLDLGGHMASYQSASAFYEVCFNHFFRAANDVDGGDLVYYQGHISPGIYSRAFVEGRLTEEQLDNFRQEVDGKGIPSYPHPKLMPEFWQFPTVSMGLGPISAIYQARFLKYLEGRGLKDTSSQRVYAFLGDGEMDEPESRGAISFAAREKLDNLCFLINCNLQRLDGPVMGNGKIIQELEGLFKGAGWNVVKVIWGNNWDSLLAKDTSGKLLQLMNETIDGDYQTFKSKDGAYVREHFFGKYPETAALVADMTDDEIFALKRGGHDSSKLFAAFNNAKETQGKPTVILAKTIKGYGMGDAAEGKNIAHGVKKMDMTHVQHLRDRLGLQDLVSDEDMKTLPYLKLEEGSAEYNYLHARRDALHGYTPKRLRNFTNELAIPALDEFKPLLDEQKRDISTTMAFVRILNILLKDKGIGKNIVPIIADEARTFGMEGLFRQVGIYNPHGQEYTPEDRGVVSYYKEATSGQVLQEGINELGAMSSWVAAATSYSTNDLPMIPFYIYYSMFGFQRVGDMAWMAGDQQARGFLLGATAGRTTLNGEGLQHEDGHSHVLANTVPNCISYDPTFAYELAVIMQDGIRRMYGEQENVFYYLTTMNENYAMPAMPEGAEEGIRKGIYKLESYAGNNKVQLMSSGTIMNEVRKAAQILSEEYGVASDVYSVTSFNELTRDGQNVERFNMLHPEAEQQVPYITQVMGTEPAIAATDYMKNYAEQVRAFMPSESYKVLGTDGFGRSDSRENLRRHFEVNASYVVVAALNELAKRGDIEKSVVADAIKKFDIDTEKMNPLYA